MSAIHRAATSVANTFLAKLQRLHPRICGLCGEPHPNLAFCQWCTDSLPGVAIGRCERCAAPLRAKPGSPCLVCQKQHWAFERTVTLADYAMPLDRLILTAKHHRQPQLLTNAAHSLAKAASARLPYPGWPELIVPVPLSPARLRKRGFNQSALIARVLAQHWRSGLSLGALDRLRDTRPQQSLGLQARRDNLTAAFKARRIVEGKRVLLVDDVMTSGATLHWAAVALREAGASLVWVATVAKTP